VKYISLLLPFFMKYWQTSKRKLSLEKTLVMGILNVTPDSFSDGGKFFSINDGLRQAERMIAESVDIIDIGGESSRPKSTQISVADELSRIIPLIEAILKRFDIPISIDTTKSEVAKAAMDSGAEIINDISGLRFDENVAKVAKATKAGLVLMHLRGTFETMHSQPPIENILNEVSNGFIWSLKKAKDFGVEKQRIALDIGIGFSKTFEQNLELLANLKTLKKEFLELPFLIGTSRKSFIGNILNNIPSDERLAGSLSSAAIGVWNGANIVRVHDVRESVQAIKVVEALLFSMS
jgi:dihydropteroate synthase